MVSSFVFVLAVCVAKMASAYPTIISSPGYGQTILSASPLAQSIISAPALSTGLISSGCGCGPVLSSPCAAPTIVAPSIASPVVSLVDDTVSNNLANCLQLLVVSNLLGNTLPLNQCNLNGLCSGPIVTSPTYLF